MGKRLIQSEKTPETDTAPKPPQTESTTANGNKLTLTDEQKLLVEGWEQSHGRKMTDQEIQFGIDYWDTTVGEL